MREADALDAASSLGRMYGAGEGRVAELAAYIERQMSCASCLALALEALFERIERFPAPKHVLAVYREANDSPRHAAHSDSTLRQAQIGKAEVFWRQEAPRIIAPFVDGDPLLAAWVAAEMWDSTVIQPSGVRQECEKFPHSSFIAAAKARVGTPTKQQVETMYAIARQAVTTDIVAMPQDEWNARQKVIATALAWEQVA